jgi:hypothetical protein
VLCPYQSSSAEGSDEPTDCLCTAGYAGPDGGPCSLCGAGTYKNSTRSGACDACPPGKTSPAGSEAEADCRCVPGHGVAAGAPPSAPCLPCPSGSFAPGGNQPCESCGWGTVTEPPAAAEGPESCRCDAARGLIET